MLQIERSRPRLLRPRAASLRGSVESRGVGPGLMDDDSMRFYYGAGRFANSRGVIGAVECII